MNEPERNVFTSVMSATTLVDVRIPHLHAVNTNMIYLAQYVFVGADQSSASVCKLYTAHAIV